MTQPTAFSYSRLNSFEECPKKFHALSISKSFKEKESPPMLEGKRVHKALELRIKLNRKLPDDLTKHEPMMQRLAAAPGVKLTEYQMAVTQEYQPTDWFASNVWCRAIADLAIKKDDRAALFDYKTGKMSNDFSQMRLTGAVFMHLHPEVMHVTLAYVWLKDKQTTTEKMARADIGEVWGSLMPRIKNYQTAFEQTAFPARPGRQCKWCPVKTCPYWEGE